MKYRLTKPFSTFPGKCPPDGIDIVFPLFNGEHVTMSEQECIVTFDGPTTVIPFEGIRIQQWNETSQTWEPLTP